MLSLVVLLLCLTHAAPDARLPERAAAIQVSASSQFKAHKFRAQRSSFQLAGQVLEPSFEPAPSPQTPGFLSELRMGSSRVDINWQQKQQPQVAP